MALVVQLKEPLRGKYYWIHPCGVRAHFEELTRDPNDAATILLSQIFGPASAGMTLDNCRRSPKPEARSPKPEARSPGTVLYVPCLPMDSPKHFSVRYGLFLQ